jgi:hypothetical protein
VDFEMAIDTFTITVTDGNLSVDPSVAVYGTAFIEINITAGTGYLIPAAVNGVTVGGNDLDMFTDYDYDPSTGILTIDLTAGVLIIDGNVVIDAVAGHEEYTISGKVTDHTDGTGIPGVTITYEINGEDPASCLNGEDGTYTITAFTGQSIAITGVSKDGWSLTDVSIVLPAGPFTAETSDADFIMVSEEPPPVFPASVCPEIWVLFAAVLALFLLLLIMWYMHKDDREITLTITGNGSVDVTADGRTYRVFESTSITVKEGKEITLTAVGSRTFSGWVGDHPSSYRNIRFTPAGDTAVEAIFLSEADNA